MMKRLCNRSKNRDEWGEEIAMTMYDHILKASWELGRSVRPKNLKKCLKLNWNFQRGGEASLWGRPLCGGGLSGLSVGEASLWGRYGYFLELRDPLNMHPVKLITNQFAL